MGVVFFKNQNHVEKIIEIGFSKVVEIVNSDFQKMKAVILLIENRLKLKIRFHVIDLVQIVLLLVLFPKKGNNKRTVKIIDNLEVNLVVERGEIER